MIDALSLLSHGGWFARLSAVLATGRDDAPLLRRPATSRTEALVHAEQRLELLNAVLALEEPLRSAVILRFVEERDVPSVGRLMRVSEVTAQRFIGRGIDVLAARDSAGVRRHTPHGTEVTGVTTAEDASAKP